MFRRLSAVIAFCIWLPLNSHSQSERSTERDTVKSYQVEEVVVTATRTSKKIIDVPYSIERIDHRQYRFDKKVAVNDVLESVPGLFLQSRYGNHDVRISIRGFGSRSNSGIRGVRILLDGIPESEPDGQTRIEAIDFQSIGRIEVVKGNLSSLYSNAPGGVINFINDVDFLKSSAVNFNEFGSFGFRSNGLKTGIRSEKYGFLLTYNYHQARGYRGHSDDYWHIVNTVLEISPGDDSNLWIYGNFVDGLLRLPGSLTRVQFDQDQFQPNARDVSRDSKRITKKGRLGLQFNTFIGENKNNEFEVTGYGTIKYFERTARTYRIFNRYGLGGSARYVNRTEFLGNDNEFSVGGDLFYQTGPIEEYENINGKKGDILDGITDETIGNVGIYFQNTFNLIEGKLDFLLTGRYDKVFFDSKNLLLEVQNDTRSFESFTPKAALNYKLAPSVAAYTSYGISFDSPAFNEMDNYPTSSKPTSLLNPDLQPQKSKNFELGLKGNISDPGAKYFNNIFFEATFFNSKIDDEIVPFEVFGDAFFRNSAKTNRSGLEIGGNVQMVRGLRLKAAYTFSDFTYEKYTARTMDLDSTGNMVITDRDFGGNGVPSVPKHNLSVSLSYEEKIAEGIIGFAKGNYLNISGMFTDDQNTERTNAYQLLNSTFGLDFDLGSLNILLSGGVNNVFNLTYVAFVNINSASKEFYEAGEPRNYFAVINLGYRL